MFLLANYSHGYICISILRRYCPMNAILRSGRAGANPVLCKSEMSAHMVK